MSTDNTKPIDPERLVSVSLDGAHAYWYDGEFFGDPEMIARAITAAEEGEPVAIFPGAATVSPGFRTARGALAALLSGNGGAEALSVDAAPDEALRA